MLKRHPLLGCMAWILRKSKRHEHSRLSGCGGIQRIFTRDSLQKGVGMNLLATRIKASSSINFHHRSCQDLTGQGRRAPRMVPRTVLYSYALATEYGEYLGIKKSHGDRPDGHCQHAQDSQFNICGAVESGDGIRDGDQRAQSHAI